MEEEKQITVPYIVYEGAQARQERTLKRLITVIIILLCMLFATNAMWLYVWNSYEYTEEYIDDIDIDGGRGNANYIGGDLNGRLINGENQGDEDPAQNTD